MILRIVFWVRNWCDTYLIKNACRIHEPNCEAGCSFCGNECPHCCAIQFLEKR